MNKMIVFIVLLFSILVFIAVNLLTSNSNVELLAGAPAENDVKTEDVIQQKIINKITKNVVVDKTEIETETTESIEKIHPKEVVLSKAESKHARRIVTNDYAKNLINVASFRDIKYQEFEMLLNDLSSSAASQKSIEDQSKYINIFNEAISAGSSFDLERLECGAAFCLASIVYDDKQNISNLHTELREKGGFDGKGFGIFGNNTSFNNQKKQGIVFTNAEDRASAYIPWKNIKVE